MLQLHGWRSLITSEHQQHLRQHCVVCARWIVDPTALKRHLKQAHKDIWSQVTQGLEKHCSELTGDLIRDGICPYCDRTSYNRHYRQCNVIFQSAIAGLLLCSRDDGDRNAYTDVPASASGACFPDRTDANTNAAASTGEGSAKKAPRPEGGSQQPEQQRGGHAADYLPTDCPGSATRGRTQSGSTQHQRDVLSATTGTRFNIIAALQGQSGMAKEPDRRSGSRGSPRHNPKCAGSGNHGEAHNARGQPASSRRSQESRHPERRQQDAVPEMERSQQEVGTRCSSPAPDPEEVRSTLTEVKELIRPDIVTRFHASRPLRQEPQDQDRTVFTLEIALRNEDADKMHSKLRSLCNHSVWGLVCAQLREPTLQRHGLAAALQKVTNRGTGRVHSKGISFSTA